MIHIMSRSCRELTESVLKSLLILVSSNIHCQKTQMRYFLASISACLNPDDVTNLVDSLFRCICTFPSPTGYVFWSRSDALPSTAKLAVLLFDSLFFPSVDPASREQATVGDRLPSDEALAVIDDRLSPDEALAVYSDFKSFALMMRLLDQTLPLYPQTLSLQDLTPLTMLLSLLINFCPDFRRFVLSKLDNESLLLAIGRTMYFLKRGRSNQRPQLLVNLYLLGQVFLSLTEDATLLRQVFDCVRMDGCVSAPTPTNTV